MVLAMGAVADRSGRRNGPRECVDDDASWEVSKKRSKSDYP